MNNFDARARDWDKDKVHMDRAIAIAEALEKMVPLNNSMKALEYGAGTGILSFLLKDKFAEIVLMDNSNEMIKVCEEKVDFYKTKHIKPVCIDLEKTDYDQKFDIIYNQMVLHHIEDTDAIFKKFYSLLNPGGCLVIADLFTEDGSFHESGTKVHWGFDPNVLSNKLLALNFSNIRFTTCYVMKRDSGKEYPIFLLAAQKEIKHRHYPIYN